MFKLNLKDNRTKRKLRTRSKIYGTLERPRLSVFRSNTAIYAQIIDDNSGKTLVSAKGYKNVESCLKVGKELADKALKAKIKTVVFDKNGYKYHGRVKSLAEGAREGGLVF